MNRTRALLLATAVPLLIVLGVLVSALVGDDSPPSRPAPTAGAPVVTTAARAPSHEFAPAGTDRVDVGSGPHGAAIFRPRGGRATGGVVVFLHGWAAVDPASYGAWIAHLVHRGATVIYPAYQESPYVDTVSPLPNALVALRLAFERVRVAPGRLVVAGHSAGGALAADYAASARAAGLPVPAAVFSVYPGRALRGIPLRIPAVSARNIRAGTRVVAYASATDRVVGTQTARTIVRTATRARTQLRIIHDPRVAYHNAPGGSGPASRRTFWAALDRLLAAAA